MLNFFLPLPTLSVQGECTGTDLPPGMQKRQIQGSVGSSQKTYKEPGSKDTINSWFSTKAQPLTELL